MRILSAHPGPHFSVADVHNGWTEALREVGNQVAEYNLGDRIQIHSQALVEIETALEKDHLTVTMDDGQKVRLRKAFSSEQAILLSVDGLYSSLYRLRPDVLFVTHAQYYPPSLYDLARSNGVKVVLMHTECPYEDEKQIQIAAHADINLINDPTNLDKFKEVAPTYYAPHSYRDEFHVRRSPVKELMCDLAFVGTGFHSRMKFFEAMDLDGLDVLLAGNWPFIKGPKDKLGKHLANEYGRCLDNGQTIDVYSSATMGMNLYRKEADPDEEDGKETGWACGPREIEMAAIGLFFLREARGESDELFPMLPSFNTPDEASELLHWWLCHEDLRQEAAVQAQAAIADRTFKNRASELMQLLEGIK